MPPGLDEYPPQGDNLIEAPACMGAFSLMQGGGGLHSSIQQYQGKESWRPHMGRKAARACGHCCCCLLLAPAAAAIVVVVVVVGPTAAAIVVVVVVVGTAEAVAYMQFEHIQYPHYLFISCGKPLLWQIAIFATCTMRTSNQSWHAVLRT